MRIILSSVLAVTLMTSFACKPRNYNGGEAQSVAPGKVYCTIDNNGPTRLYFQGNMGLFPGGVFPSQTRLKFHEVFTGANRQQGEFQRVTFVDGAAQEALTYVFASELDCRTQTECNRRIRKDGGVSWIRFASSDAEPVNVRVANASGNPANGKIVAKIDSRTEADTKMVYSNNMVAPEGWMAVPFVAYIKTRGADGSDLFGSTFGTCAN